MPSSDSLFQLESVWPDLAKYHHFGKYLKTFGNIFKVDLVLEKVFNSLWHNLFAIGQVFNAENGQILKAQFGHLVTLIGILFFNLGSGCAPVGREVASDSRSLRFESCLWQKFILNIYSQLFWKSKCLIKVCRWLNSNRRPPRKRPLYQRSHNHSPMLLHWQLLVKFCSILSNICLKRKTFLRIALFCPSEDFRPEYDRNVW